VFLHKADDNGNNTDNWWYLSLALHCTVWRFTVQSLIAGKTGFLMIN